MRAEAFTAALSAEHAAIYGYGLVGARLAGPDQAAARDAEAAHRNRRDLIAGLMVAADASPPPAEPAYAVPFPVTDRASALRLAASLEDGTARAWHQAIAGTTADERKVALEALVDSAVRATRWRKLAGTTPATVPFPGRPA